MRKYIIIDIEREGEPIIAEGKAPFSTDDSKLVPTGYQIVYVHNSPTLKKIAVSPKGEIFK